jgi:hypothetical protein
LVSCAATGNSVNRVPRGSMRCNPRLGESDIARCRQRGRRADERTQRHRASVELTFHGFARTDFRNRRSRSEYRSRRCGARRRRCSQRVAPPLGLEAVEQHSDIGPTEVVHQLVGRMARATRRSAQQLARRARSSSRPRRRHAADRQRRGWRPPAPLRSQATADHGQNDHQARQENPVQPREHGPGLRITRAYRNYSARVPTR